MGCFLGCFGSSKDAKRRTHRSKQWNDCSRKEQQISSVEGKSKAVLSSTSSQVKVKPGEQLNLNASTRKKVTFDTNVKTYEPVLVDEVADLQPEKSEEGGKEEALVKSQLNYSSEDSSVTSTGSHRYQNCRDSDAEDEEMDYWDSDLTDDDGDKDCDGDIGEEYDEFGEEFEDGLVCSRARIAVNEVFVEEVENDPILTCDRDVRSIGSNPRARDRSVYVHPVLNPVENLSQWKEVKAKRAPPLRSQKENCISSQDSRIDPSKKLSQEIAVDASLSNWLVSSEATTPVKKASLVAVTPESSRGSNSTISYEDRPILGALTVEELRQLSVSTSPRKSPSQNLDEMAIMGTVGTYWNLMDSAEDSGSATSSKGITQRGGRVQVK